MRYTLFPAFLILAAAPAMAGPREDATAGIARCGAIPDDRTYLNCIYGAVQSLRAQLRLPPAPADQIRLVPPGAMSAPLPRAAMSVPPPRAANPTPPSQYATDAAFAAGMRERLDTFSFTSQGLFNIRLENGEMYKQDAGDRPRAKLLGRGSDYVVYVIKESGGTALMKITGDPNVYRMRKVN